MTPRLSTEFKRESHEHLLNTSRQLISEELNTTMERKTIYFDNDQMKGDISKKFWTNPYLEEYHVNIETTIQNQKIRSTFYLEWKNNDMNTELYCPDRKLIKINKCK
jgi:hypothetical protein